MNDQDQAYRSTKNLGTEDLDVPVLQFMKVDRYSFSVEHALDGDNITFHFFLPKHLQNFPVTGELANYWDVRFGEALDRIAQSHFSAGAERLRASHVDDMGINSWWMSAAGYANISHLQEFIDMFYDLLDAALNKNVA
jgi:hypothetical protein